MNALWVLLAALAALLCYCLYCIHRQEQQRRHQQLRERVAYMLWVMAERSEESDSRLTAS